MNDYITLLESLRCPRCRGEFNFKNISNASGTLTCQACLSTYNMQDGIYHLYVEDQSTPQERGTDDQEWDKAAFEAKYEQIGYYKSGQDFDRSLGYPEEVSLFLYERVKKRLLAWIDPGSPSRILDVGCGTGYFLLQSRKKASINNHSPIIIGIDISETELRFMSHRFQEEQVDNYVIINGNSEFLPFADNYFDLVTCSEVIEHVSKPQKALVEINRVLKTEGLLLLSTPSMTAQKGWDVLLRPFRCLRWLSPNYHPTEKSKDYDIPWYDNELKDILVKTNFKILNFEYNAIIPHPWYFKFIPRILLKPTIFFFTIVDRYLKLMFKRLALHFVIKAQKQSII